MSNSSDLYSFFELAPGFYVVGLIALIVIWVWFGKYKKKRIYRIVMSWFDIGWDALARLGRTKIMQLTIIAPILGYFIIFNDYIMNNYTVFGNFPLWKVSFLYLGLISLSAASIGYSFLCPKIVRLYETPADYIVHNLDFTFKQRLRNLIQKIHLRYKKYAGDWVFVKPEIPHHVITLIGRIRGIEDVERKISELESAIEEMENYIRGDEYAVRDLPTRKELLYADYLLSVDDKRSARVVVFWLYFVGFVLVSIPTIFMVIEVVCKILGAIFDPQLAQAKFNQ